MNANQNEQLSGGCRDFPGASERNYVVRGQTYRYRRYLRSIGLYWASWAREMAVVAARRSAGRWRGTGGGRKAAGDRNVPL